MMHFSVSNLITHVIIGLLAIQKSTSATPCLPTDATYRGTLATELRARDRQPVFYIQYAPNESTMVCSPAPNMCTCTMLNYVPYGQASGDVKLYMFDQNCLQTGYAGSVSRDQLASPGGYSFSSELPEYLVLHVNRAWHGGNGKDPKSENLGVTFAYNSVWSHPLVDDSGNLGSTYVHVDSTGGTIYQFNGQFQCRAI